MANIIFLFSVVRWHCPQQINHPYDFLLNLLQRLYIECNMRDRCLCIRKSVCESERERQRKSNVRIYMCECAFVNVCAHI